MESVTVFLNCKRILFAVMIAIWGMGCQKPITPFAVLSSREPIIGIVLSSQGDRLLTMQKNNALFVWNNRGFLLSELGLRGPATDAAFSRDGTKVLFHDENGTVRVWDYQNMLIGNLGNGTDIAFSADGSKVFMRLNQAAQIWDAKQGILLQDFGFGGGFSSDGIHLVGMKIVGVLELWDIQSMTKLKVLTNDGSPFLCPNAVFSADQTRVLVWSDTSTFVWDITTGAFLQELEVSKTRPILNAALSADGSTLMLQIQGNRSAACTDQDICLERTPWIQLWDATSGGFLGTIKDAIFKQFSPDGSLLLTYDSQYRQRVDMWDARTGEPKAEMSAIFVQGTALFSPAQQRVLTVPIEVGTDPSAQPRAQIWDAAGQLQATLDFKEADAGSDWIDHDMARNLAQFGSRDWLGHYLIGHLAQFSQDGSWVAVLCSDGVVRIWDVSGITS